MACSSIAGCPFKEENRVALTKLICDVRNIRHQIQCSSTWMTGNTSSFCPGPVPPQDMTTLAEELETLARGLRDDVKEHAGRHDTQIRQIRGRAQQANQTDSGVHSWAPPETEGRPIQEQNEQEEEKEKEKKEEKEEKEEEKSSADDDLLCAATIKNAVENLTLAGDDSSA